MWDWSQMTTAVMQNMEESARMLAKVAVEKSTSRGRTPTDAAHGAGVNREALAEQMMADFQVLDAQPLVSLAPTALVATLSHHTFDSVDHLILTCTCA